MEYVLKQSLAEDEFRRLKSKGVGGCCHFWDYQMGEHCFLQP